MEMIMLENPFEPDDILDAVIEKWEIKKDGLKQDELKKLLKKSEPKYTDELLEAYLEKLTDDRSLMSWKGKYYPFRALKSDLFDEVVKVIMETGNRYNKTQIKNIDPGYFKEHYGISQGAINWVIRKLEREQRILTFSRTVAE